jgi:proline-specific peptidase
LSHQKGEERVKLMANLVNDDSVHGQDGRLISLEDTRLYIVERGQGYPLFLLHGGPGLDHHEFGDYLDPLTDSYRLILVDQRGQGRSDRVPEESLSLEQMAADVVSLAAALELERYAVLGHSYGALVALQNAVDFPGQAAQTIVSSGFPSARFLAQVEQNLKDFEPVELRKQVADSWAREPHVQTPEEVAELLRDQLPFHFADPRDPRIKEFQQRTAGEVYSPDVLRYFASQDYGGIEVEDRLGLITQPVLVLAGRYDRTCSVEAAQAIAKGVPQAELVVFENSAHMTYVEETKRYLQVVREFLDRHGGV